ncbi:nucleotidyltransferase family protein [Actinopolymorpha sp. B9G3]|uniref:nucleotidyltransferase family protein n=1 Tax=Actinopolymorpha sp. B9G3 TaxID=3158970 RepID=UPI0032D98F48
MTNVAGLLLAAGEGARFGRPKALVEFGGQLLVERGLRLLTAGGCAPVHVVLGAAYDEILATADLADATTVVRNDAWPTGLGSSLRAGLASMPPDVGAVVIALVDQPLVTATAVERLRAAYAAGAVAAVATYGEHPRHPVLLARAVWKDIAELATGDAGARGFLRSRPDLVTKVPCDDVGSAADIDTPDDLATLRDDTAADS